MRVDAKELFRVEGAGQNGYSLERKTTSSKYDRDQRNHADPVRGDFAIF